MWVFPERTTQPREAASDDGLRTRIGCTGRAARTTDHDKKEDYNFEHAQGLKRDTIYQKTGWKRMKVGYTNIHQEDTDSWSEAM
jgi:hypothetical protein